MALLAIGRVRIGMAMAATVVVRHRAVNGIVGERVLGGADLVLHARAGHLAEHGRSHCAPDGEQDDQHKQQPDAEGFHDGRLLREGFIGRTGTQVLSPLRILEEQCEGGESESVSRGIDKHQDRPHPLL